VLGDVVYNPKKKEKHDWGIGSFILGLFLIPLSLVCIWKNERKIVVYHKLMDKAKANLVEMPNAEDAVDGKHEYELVHVRGITKANDELECTELDYKVQNCYRLKVVTEQYQWVETQREERVDKDHTRTVYDYSKQWRTDKVDSSHFHERQNHQNPDKAWPINVQHTASAKDVQLGTQYVLKEESHSRLGSYVSEGFQNDEQGKLQRVMYKLKPLATNNHFRDFECRQLGGEYYLFSSSDESATLGTEHIGSFRISLQYAECGEANVMGQLVADHQSKWTFRKWNPEKEKVPYGEDTSQRNEAMCACYYLCACVNYLFDVLAEEVVFEHWDGARVNIAPKEIIKGNDAAIQKLGCFLRPTCIFMCMFGFYLLFAPIIQLLAWIPLVGWLLAWIVKIAAAITAFFFGGTISCLTMAVAWVRFRPCVGITLLVLVGLGIAAIFVVPIWLEKDKEAKKSVKETDI